MASEKIVVYGAGGLGREILQLLRATERFEILGFIDDGVEPGSIRNDVRVLGGAAYLETLREPFSVVLGIFAPTVKQRIWAVLGKNALVSFPSVIHPRAYVDPESRIGDGVVVCADCIVSIDAAIGDAVLLNCGAFIGHDDDIGRFSSIMPRVTISGCVTIGERAVVGAGAAIIQGTRIGDDSTVGIGSVVIRDVPHGATVLGNPARRIA